MSGGPAGDGKAGGKYLMLVVVDIVVVVFNAKCFCQMFFVHVAIREAGGAFGKLEVAREEEYFYKKVKKILNLHFNN